MLKIIVRFLFALALLYVMLYLGKLLAYFFPIGISDSIWGLLILFALLVLNVIKLEWVLPATRPMIRYMAIFFLPISAGIIDYTEILQTHFWGLFVANFMSVVISIVLIGWLAQYLFHHIEEREKLVKEVAEGKYIKGDKSNE